MFQIGIMPSTFIPHRVVVDCKDSGDSSLYPAYGHVVGCSAYTDINRSGHVFSIQTVEKEQAYGVNCSLCDICFVGLRPTKNAFLQPLYLNSNEYEEQRTPKSTFRR